MFVTLVRGTLAVCVVAATCAVEAKESFVGTWETTFGPMHLQQTEDEITGFYLAGDLFCKIHGKVAGSQWTFAYDEIKTRGEGSFTLAADGQSFSGRWRPEGSEAWYKWFGIRLPSPDEPGTFVGVWNTSFGRLRLTGSGQTIEGCYAIPYGATVSGRLEGRRLNLEYHEPNNSGEAVFDLAPDGRSFVGYWRPKGTTKWLDWYGVRVDPVPGRMWLVVAEVHWEKNLAESEYSFGAMLRPFFARKSDIQVRQRFVADAFDLERVCHEVVYLTEPVVLVVAAHGSGKGIAVGGQMVGSEAFTHSLRFADQIKLLHFSSCAVMQDKLPGEVQAAFPSSRRFPISGYVNDVDWAGSAMLEFLYFDMILVRSLTPAKAAEQVNLLVPFASETPIPGSRIGPAGFKFLDVVAR